ncbi:MAG: choice-of-anchor D domain-containing protein [Thioploca sp.]|nr:choice-of-anchor D domain-containing protein [Thioploca sp.]
MTTTDPQLSTVTYPLACTGKSAIYDSTPINSTVDFGKVLVGSMVEKIITFRNKGNVELIVDWGITPFDPPFLGRGISPFITDPDSPATFTLVGWEDPDSFPIYIEADSQESGEIKIQCQPTTEENLTATLLLNSNDPNQLNIQYQLTCSGVQPRYDSKPVAPNETLDFGEIPIETEGETMLEIQEIGTADLEIKSATLLDDAEAVFNLVAINFPLTIPNDGGESQIITVQCKPLEIEKIYTAKLKLTTNAINYPEPIYELTCKGGPPVAGARYHSTPFLPGNTLDFGKVTVGSSRDKTFTIKEIGNLALVVQVANSLKSKEFALVSPSFFPNLTIRDGEEGVLVTFRCQPLQEGTYTDQIRFTTNDSMLPELSYNLRCIGVAAPGYSSSPVLPGGTIDFGAGPTGISISKTLEIKEVGSKDLIVDLADIPITGTHPNSFSLKDPTFHLVIADNAPAQTMAIQCTPTVLGTQTAILNLTSNDSSYSVIKYNLKCTGIDLSQLVNLTVETAGNGSGSVSPQLSDNIKVEKCGANCFSYAKETPVTLTAIPNQGSTFTHWAGGCSGTEAIIVVNMSQNTTCIASFEPIVSTPNQLTQNRLTIKIMGSGTVTSQPAGLDCPSTTCSANYPNNTEVTLTTLSAKDFNLSEISGDCDAQGHVKLDTDKVCEITFTQNIIHTGQLQFTQTEFKVNSQTSDLTLTVTRTDGTEGQVEVNYYATNDQGVQVDNLEGILQWSAGDDSNKMVALTIAPERFLDTDYLLIHLANPTGGATLGTQSVATIQVEKLPITVKTTSADIMLCPLTPVINIVCHLNWQTGKNITVGEEGNISSALLEGHIVNKGWIGNFVLQPESTLTGGNITGYILNHGEISDVKFKGASLEGGTLAGTIWNESPANGVIRDVTIAENSKLIGGIVGGQILNQGTLTDIQFRGTQISGGALSGHIDNVSGGIIQDVVLAENTQLDGGRLQGNIKGIGKGDSRPLLTDVIITPDTQLENVRIGKNVSVPPGFQFSSDVTFAEQPHFVTDTFINGKVNGNGQLLENITINEQGKLTNAILAGTVINLGKVSDITLQTDSFLTGGTLSNEIINNGTISDVELNQAHLVGGNLEGQINASGSILENVSLGAGTQLKGGELRGQIQGDAQFPARLDSLTVAKDGYVENAIIGQRVKNQGTLADIEFQGTTLFGGILSGQVIISRGGTVRDVKLAPNTSVNGGNLKGKIIGDSESPARLDNVVIAADSYLENIVIGDNVEGRQLKIGNNVTMAATGIQLISGTQQNLGQQDDTISEPPPLAVQVLDLKTGQLTENLSAKFVEDIRTSLGEKRSSGALLSYLDAEVLKISATITNQTSVPQTADLIMIAYYQSVEGTSYYLQYDVQQQQWTPWDFNFHSLKPAQSQPLLFNPKQPVKITAFEGDLSPYPGQFELYIGYRSIKDNTLTFNGVKPITFYVGIAPPSCIVYAVHDAGINDTQLIKINLSGGLDGDMEPLGALHKGYDIEGLALNPSNLNLLYGTAGENAKVDGQPRGGYLYTINRQTGEVFAVGPTGFNKVSGLGLNPKDNTLWGWGSNQGKNSADKWNGLIKIDPQTGHSEMIKQFDSPTMEGVAWDYQGSKLYVATGTTLWFYDPTTQELQVACENVTNEGKIEGLDMQPNGSLLIGVDYDKPTQTTIFAYDPQKCERVEKATRTFWGTYYDDLESFVWPSGECGNQSWL